MKPRQRMASGAFLLGCWLAVSMSSAAAAALVAQTLTL
ncbi:hypothetical protein CBA19C6_29340 [Cupriavidus pauculus]|nr:hypothetical protein CBA19C6_29340 [Cupriavidus pauculus]